MANAAASPITLGFGPDQVAVTVSEDAYLGDAQFTLSIDGVQIGDVQTATALHALGQQQSYVLDGYFGPGPHTLGVDFLNDLYAGTPNTDRNLWLDQVQVGTVSFLANDTPLYSAGLLKLPVIVPPPPSVPVGTGPDQIAVSISEDAYQGDAQFTFSVDGVQIGGVQTATELHATGQHQTFLLNGTFGFAAHTLTVNFLNDLYGGTPQTDRNLYVNSITRDGFTSAVNQVLYSAGPLDLSLGAVSPPTGPVTIGSGPDSIVLGISQDYYLGNAQFTVSVDGTQVGDIQSATATHGGASQLFTVLGSFGPGPHTVEVRFLNDLYGGTPATDRNLWVDTIAYAGTLKAVGAVLYSAGPMDFTVAPPAVSLTGSNLVGPASGMALLTGTSGDDTIVAHGSGNTIIGNGGNDTITGGEAGHDAITLGGTQDTGAVVRDTVAISGAGNLVSLYNANSFLNPGTEAVALSGAASGTTANLGAGANTVDLAGFGNSISVGIGANTIMDTGGGATIHINGFESSGSYSDAITLDGPGNTVQASAISGKYPASGDVTVTGGTGNGHISLGWGTGTVHTDGPNNQVSFGYGTFDVTPGSGNDSVSANSFPGSATGTIHLAGLGNSVTGGSGSVLTVVGGDGSGTFEFDHQVANGPDNSSIVTGGTGNSVVLRGGASTMVDAGSGTDTVAAYGGHASLVFRGASDVLFLHPGPPQEAFAGPGTTTVQDLSAGLQVSVDPSFGSLTLNGFSPTGVIHLLGAAGGYTTPDQAAAAVVYGAGSATLAVDAGSIVFNSATPLAASQFAIG